MAQYTVRHNQNLYDIAVLLHGSIEGIFDLLISNKELSMNTILTPGMVLEYHDYYTTNDEVLEVIRENGYMPANGEREVYFKSTDKPIALQFEISNNLDHALFRVGGTGTITVDWGDNSQLEDIVLSETKDVEHYFDDQVDEVRVIRFYGDFQITEFFPSVLADNMYTMKPLDMEEFTCSSLTFDVANLEMMSSLSKIALVGTYVEDLSPIYDKKLTELNLKDAHVEPAAIDGYLQHIVSNYGDRVPCSVSFTDEPSTVGMEAIQTIIGTPGWNEDGKWTFNINGTIYTAQ